MSEVLLTPEMRQVLSACENSTINFGKVFFQDEFSLPFSPVHEKMIKVIDGDGNYRVISAPRGIGKTTTVAAYIARKILYRKVNFVVYVSKTEGHAIMQTENIKEMLTSDDKIVALFGDIRFSTLDEDLAAKPQFSKKTWIANNYTVVVPRGAGQQIRGSRWRHYRPDLIVFDDLEDDELIDSETYREKLKIWFFTAALKAVPQHHRNWEVIYIDTIKHQDAMILKLLESELWKAERLSICDENYKTLAPGFKTQEDLDLEIAQYRELHMVDAFAREFMSMPVSSEDASFKSEYFKYYSETDQDFVTRLRSGKIETVVIGDPAKTPKMGNAKSAIVVWGVDVEESKLYERGAFSGYWDMYRFFGELLDKAEFFGASAIAIETTGIDMYITQPFKNYMNERGKYYELIEVTAKAGRGQIGGYEGGKKGRARALLPYYYKGQIIHNVDNCGLLEQALMSFPRPEKWDVIDAAAHIIFVLQYGQRWFFGGTECGSDGMPIEGVDDFALIEANDYDKPVEDWMIA